MEEVLDWLIHLEHLQILLKKFDPVTTFNKDIFIKYF